MQISLPDHLPPLFEIRGGFDLEDGFTVGWSFRHEDQLYGSVHKSRVGFEPLLERAFKAMSENWLSVTGAHKVPDV